MAEYIVKLYPSNQYIEKAYISLDSARKAAYAAVKKGSCTQGTIYSFDGWREYGAVFVYKGKMVYRREPMPRYHQEYGLWDVYPSGKLGVRRG